MSQATVPARNAVDPRYTWNAPSVFASIEAWEAEFKQVQAGLARLDPFRGHLAGGPAVLADALAAVENLVERAYRLYVYASMTYATDTSDQAAAALNGRAQGLFGQVFAATSFVDPEMIAIGQQTLTGWLQTEPRLGIYAHYLDNLFRQQAHVRSAEVEELLGMLADPFGSVGMTADLLVSADFKFQPATGSDGSPVEVTQGTVERILHEGDRAARRTAWESFADQYLAYKNTLANNLLTSVKQNVFEARARRYESTLDMALFRNNIPPQVYHNLMDIFKKNLPTWHRYWQVRRKALGVETLEPYDIWAPLTPATFKIPYAQAVDSICAGLAPMGQTYVDTVRRGCLEQRWVDVYPNLGKTPGAFSSGAYGTFPFILLSYTDDIASLSTLAHELGHSMHSYLTWQTQPFVYSDYSMFVAEVASNFHQAMVRAHLLKTNPDPAFQISIIEEAMDNFHRYFFIMPTLARFELEVHRRIEAGEGLAADDLIGLMADLFSEGYGGEMHVDRERVGITWAQFGHLYVDYYVFQYATGISGAHASAKRILDGVPGAAEDHLNFLKAGGSRYPVDALKLAGVDLSQPEPVEAAFAVLADYVDRLEKLTAG